MNSRILVVCSAVLILASCNSGKPKKVVAIDPQHFHSALALRENVEGLSDQVDVYAANEKDIHDFITRIDSYNQKGCNWVYSIHTSDNFLEKVPRSHNKDIVVLAGDNQYKTEYILEAVKKGYNVLSDKPMAIDYETDYPLLQKAYRIARRKNLCIQEMMTERYDAIYQCVRDIISELPSDSKPNKIEMTSNHYFCKIIDGKPTRRPVWYYDVKHQGEGIADVTTHYVDLVFWQTAPCELFDTTGLYVCGEHSAVRISPYQFQMSTNETIEDTIDVFCNGTLNFGTPKLDVKLNIVWDFIPVTAGGDAFEALYCCPKDTIAIIQNESTKYVRKIFHNRFEVIPEETINSHEQNFAMVMKGFMEYVRKGEPISITEEKNTLTKYYITTKAVQTANNK